MVSWLNRAFDEYKRKAAVITVIIHKWFLSIQVMDRTIKITNAKVADSGQWICIARNSAGESRKTFDLSVLGERPSRLSSTHIVIIYPRRVCRVAPIPRSQQHELLDRHRQASPPGLLCEWHSKTYPRLDEGKSKGERERAMNGKRGGGEWQGGCNWTGAESRDRMSSRPRTCCTFFLNRKELAMSCCWAVLERLPPEHSRPTLQTGFEYISIILYFL